VGKKYLVTGGLGFLGAPLVRRLVENGETVRVLDNGFRGASRRLANIAGEVEVVEGDIRDPAAVDKAINGIDCVCHLAFVNGTQYFYDRPAYVLEVGVKGMVNVLDSCIRRGVHELILASSSEVYQTPPTIPTDESAPLSIPDALNPRYSYAGGKIISELMAINYGRQYFNRVLLFRPHNVFGPDMGWEHVIPQFTWRLSKLPTQSTKTVNFEIQGTGLESRAFIYVDDFIDGVMRLIEKGQHLTIYNIGSTDERTIADLAFQIASLLGLKINLVGGREAIGGTKRRCPSIDKIQSLGFVPHRKFDDALRLTVEWYKQHAETYSVRSLESATLFVPEIR
jgi:nucleoside-diphosphate-sugar epimerase